PVLDEAARASLEHAHKTSLNAAVRRRAHLILLKAAGRTSHDVGQIVGLCDVSVNSWVKRYQQEGLAGLNTKPGRGRKPLLRVARDEVAVREAVQANRQRIALAKAEWEAQRAPGSPAVGRDTFRAFLKALVAGTNASAVG
ncbi:helix-turn-helix domain-containing protein, partial [Hymenobacter glaciei]|uniref:helix-turn-helix domain-containing protein n=1 Tax=Hymenobacter glaciei TaxID=877209 RepID=UPI0031E92FD6